MAASESGREAMLHELPSLISQSEGWQRFRRALSDGESGTIDGAWGSAAAAAVAALLPLTNGTLLVVIPGIADQGFWLEDLFTFSGERAVLFPAHDSWPAMPVRGRLSDETGHRLRTLQQLLQDPPRIILAPFAAVIQPVPPRTEFQSAGRILKVGETVDLEQLTIWLIEKGYKRVEAVEYPGEFSRRGGLLDLYPPDFQDPIRLELFGDEVESIRVFSTSSQRSLEKKSSIVIQPAQMASPSQRNRSSGALTDYLPDGSICCLIEPADLKEQGRHFFERVSDPTGLFGVDATFSLLFQRPNVVVTALPRASVEASVHLRVESVERFSGNVHRVRDELDAIAHSDRVMIACQTDAECQRLGEVLKAGRLAESERLSLTTGHVRAGFRLVDHGVVVLGSHELFHRDPQSAATKSSSERTRSSRSVESRAIDSFLDLNEGDYIVHVAHGIGRFRGMKMLEKGAAANEDEDDAEQFSLTSAAVEENLILEFRDGVFLYVPTSRIDLVQKYVGGSQTQPELSKLGGTAWGRKKDRVAEAVRDMAAEMIQLNAVRAAMPGVAFPPDSDWQTEFEASFPFQETPDQDSAIREIKADLEKAKSMDRLLCGDVGYGKTEVAIRAAFKAIDNGKQVAVLVPTTVLAEQHYRTFSQRLAEYPFVIESVSRFKSSTQQKAILKRVADGEVDILIGTHRIVSKDVRFKDLGLVVIDEEQRFGVEHKERLKHLRATVHVLTMSATPIPRTLHQALLGIREISNLETPPPDRLPVETRIVRWDEQLIRHAILRELNRGGQVYFVHNRVHDIKEIAAKLETIVPEAKLVIGHGQMNEHELEKAMVKFVRKEADILVATTIIESGLDIPNANTMFIDDADTYGLADLHQLRGRVGRTKLRAYAYFIVDAHKLVTPNAQKRLKAIEEFAELGAGFKIAMRDLEIRGAGNILGAEQSGHIASIGYELYCQLLENAVRQLKNQPPRTSLEVNIDLPLPAYLPREYVPAQKLRIEVYRRLARIREIHRLEDFRQELEDRFGKLPEPAAWLLRTTELRIHCMRWQISAVHRDGPDLVLTYKSRHKAEQVAALSGGRLKVVDERNLYLRLRPEEDSLAVIYPLLNAILDPGNPRNPPASSKTVSRPARQR